MREGGGVVGKRAARYMGETLSLFEKKRQRIMLKRCMCDVG